MFDAIAVPPLERSQIHASLLPEIATPSVVLHMWALSQHNAELELEQLEHLNSNDLNA